MLLYLLRSKSKNYAMIADESILKYLFVAVRNETVLDPHFKKIMTLYAAKQITNSSKLEMIRSGLSPSSSYIPFYNYILAYSYVFPKSFMSRYWFSYNKLLKLILDSVIIKKIELPKKYDPSLLNYITTINT